MMPPSRDKILAFRKCIMSMSDEQLVGIAKTCKVLSENIFTTQFAECGGMDPPAPTRPADSRRLNTLFGVSKSFYQ
jgi:hypothetical protein